jgi:hypothetical protein
MTDFHKTESESHFEKWKHKVDLPPDSMPASHFQVGAAEINAIKQPTQASSNSIESRLVAPAHDGIMAKATGLPALEIFGSHK